MIRKHLLPILSFAVATLMPFSSFCQTNSNPKYPCNFLQHVNFKNGEAVVKTKVIYKEFAEFENSIPQLYGLEKKGKIRRRNVTSQIGFVVSGCSIELGGPCDISNSKFIEKQPFDTEILITCRVFQGYKYSPVMSVPFFIITKTEAVKH